MKPDPKLIAAFDDLISEEELMKKTGYSKSGLKKLRQQGKVSYFTLTGHKKLYSKTEIAILLNLHIK